MQRLQIGPDSTAKQGRLQAAEVQSSVIAALQVATGSEALENKLYVIV